MKRFLVLASSAVLAMGVASPMGGADAAEPNPGHRVVVADKSPEAIPSHEVATFRSVTQRKFVVTLALRDKGGAAKAAQNISDPSSSSYRHFLKPKQFTKHFAASSADVRAVKKWLSSNGLKVGKAPASRSYLPVSGSTTAVNKAFATIMKNYRSDDRTFAAPSTRLTVPASIGTKVKGVIGLDQSRELHADNVRANPHAAESKRVLGGQVLSSKKPTDSDGCSNFYRQHVDSKLGKAKAPLNKKLSTTLCGYTPSQMAHARGISKISANGQGTSVGITLWCNDPRIKADTNRWAKDVGAPKLKGKQYKVLKPEGGYDPNYCNDTDSGGVNAEQALDVQSIHGAAPKTNIVYSSASRPFDDALLESLHALVDANKVDAITNSWGGPETDDAALNDAYSAVFMQAAIQGISVFFSSGDYGDNTNGDQTTTPPSPDYPASNPWITSVGGTSLGTANLKGNKIKFETAWNTSLATKTNDKWGPWAYRFGGGGGVSNFHTQPFYQRGVVPARFAGVDPHRVYPDMAGAGDPYTGYLIGFHDADAASGNFNLTSIGGTSWSSPYTAGTIALAVQTNGERVGFLNPVIYGKGHAGLTDISGNRLKYGFLQNRTVVTPGSSVFRAPATVAVNAQRVQNQTLTSVRGYDNLTGFGVPTNTKRFIKHLR